MVAQAQTTRTRKPSYRPHVRRESATTYTVQSERYTYVLWTITHADGRAIACTCEGNATWGKTCKHMRAVQYVLNYYQHPTHIREMVAADETATAAPEMPAPIQLPRKWHGAEGLFEAFGA